jgi:glycosyltransferase involved in cell wall biosynthesis
MTRPFLSVVIPAWNEAGRLPLTLVDIDRHLSAQDFTSEIIVVLSPSVDNTGEILKRFQSIIKNLKVVILIENQGKGFAIREGMKVALGSYRLMMDADNSTTVIEFAKMLPYLSAKDGTAFDVVIGSRFVAGAQIDPAPRQFARLMSSCKRVLVRMFFVKGIRDVGCGFKCFSAHAADLIFPKCTSNGWAIETETIARAQRFNLTIKEIPVFWSHDAESRPHSPLSLLLEHIQMYVRLRSQKTSK